MVSCTCRVTTSRMEPLWKECWFLILLHNSKEGCHPELESMKDLHAWKSPHQICYIPLLPGATVDTRHHEKQIFQRTFGCLTDKIMDTYKVLQINHTTDLPGAIMIWHKKKNVTLAEDNGRERKSCSLDHTPFLSSSRSQSDLCNSSHAMVIKIIKVYFITSTLTCKETQPELHLDVQLFLIFHILWSLRPFLLLYEAEKPLSILLQANSSLNEVNIPVKLCCDK